MGKGEVKADGGIPLQKNKNHKDTSSFCIAHTAQILKATSIEFGNVAGCAHHKVHESEMGYQRAGNRI